MAYDAEELLRAHTAAPHVAKRITQICDVFKQAIDKEGDAANLVEAFVLCRQAYDLIDTARKELLAVKDHMAMVTIPEAFDRGNLKTLTTQSGYRVTVSVRFTASFIDKERGFEWLRANNMGDLITETVNAQTLSSQIKSMITDEGKEPPEDIIKTNYVSQASVTKAK